MTINQVVRRDANGDHEVTTGEVVTLTDLSAGGLEGVNYFVETAGEALAKGDVVSYSGDDEASKVDINVLDRAIGIVFEAALAAAPVKILRDQEVLTGVLTGATFGTRYFWDGAALTTTRPSGSGQYIWQVGYAKNATDLRVDIQLIDKNS